MSNYKKSNGMMPILFRTTGNLIASAQGGQGRLCIITYHRIVESPDPLLASDPDMRTFRWQMKLLADCFNVLPLYDAVQAVKERRVPPRAVCITFDDGYRSTYDIALPILREFGLPATVFTTTGFLDGGNMWNDRIIEAVRRLPNGPLDLRKAGLGTYLLGDLNDRNDIVEKINDDAKYLPPQARFDAIDALESMSGTTASSSLMLNRGMIAELSQHGVEIGGHTVTHPILTSLDDETARNEIVRNKEELEAITGKPVRLFAYPNGKVGIDFDARHANMVKEAGYSASFTTEYGSVSHLNDIFQIPRGTPWDATPFLFGVRLLRWLAAKQFRASSNSPARNRALLIAFHFPPQSESSGIQRTLSFAKNLGESKWEPMVVSANPVAYAQKNSSQLAGLPEGLIVSRPFSLDAKRHLSVLGRYPQIIGLPDRWASWWLFAVPAGLSLIRRHRPKVIWSTFPIATAHLIGLTLQRLTGLPWIADFRDPMLQDGYPKNRLQRKAYQWIENRTIARCDKATFTTQGALESYKRRFPSALHHKFAVIENGYDEESFQDSAATELTSASAPKSEGRITLLHSGVLYAEGRDPTAFFEAICALKRAGQISSANFRVILRAPGAIPYFKELIKTCEVEDVVSIEPPVPYREALREMLAVDGLLIFQGTPFNAQIPAKIYEYLRARKPIFGLLDRAGETAKMLELAGFRHMVTMTSADAIAPVLEDFLQQIRANEAHVASDELVTASSRKHRAKQLAQLCNQVIG